MQPTAAILLSLRIGERLALTTVEAGPAMATTRSR